MITAFLCTLFFASGISALLFETLWFHQAGLAFGNSVWASSLVLSGFMGGLALGNGLAARYGDRLRNPVRAYAFAEVAIAVTGVGLVYLLPGLGATLAPWLSLLLDHPWMLNSLRLFIAFLLLVIPSTAMGVTLPVLTKALTGADPNFGRVLGRLYGWNTLGAVGGTLIGELYLIRGIGIHGTALTAGVLNLGAAAGAVWLATKIPCQALAPALAGRLTGFTGRRWLAAAFLSGFCLLALEVVWFRFILLFVLGQSVAFALMLAVVLAGIALGGLAASYWLRFVPDAHRFAAPIAFWAGLLGVASYAVFPLVIEPFATSGFTRPSAILQICVPLMFPVSFLSGVFFTLVGAALRNSLASEAETTGVLTLANTTGAVVGSLFGGFVFLPVLGIERSFFLLAVLYGGLGALLLLRGQTPRRIAYAHVVVFLVSLTFFPFGSMENHFFQIPGKRYHNLVAARIAGVREGLTETVIYFQKMSLVSETIDERRYRLNLERPVAYEMLTNAYMMSGTDYKARRYMKLYVYWPMAVHPNLKRALLICYGVGNTAKALTDSKSIESIDVVDISRDVLEMNTIVYPDTAEQPLHDPRVRVHIEDGRYFLQMTEQRFDLITAEPPPPDSAGAENLYTREYFQLLHDRLAEGGIVTYWLPLHSLTDVSTKAILRAFCDVFEDCSLWNGAGTNLMMVGTRNAQGPVPEEQFIRQWKDPVVAAEMGRLGFERPEQLGALFIGDADYLNGLLVNSTALTDNYPKLIVAPRESEEETLRLLRSFTGEDAAQERFRNSPLTKHLWPERLLAASLPYFKIQNMINFHFYGNLIRRSSVMEDVHRYLNESPLSTPVLWRLGSDSDIQRIVATAGPAELANPDLQFHLGLRFISERNYAAAVEPLSRAEAEQRPQLHEAAVQLRIYALCMSGQTDQAQQVVAERLAQMIREKGVTATGSLNEASRVSSCR